MKSNEISLLQFAILTKILNQENLHPVERMCLKMLCDNLEDVSNKHPLFRQLYWNSSGGDSFNRKTLSQIRGKVIEPQIVAQVEQFLDPKITQDYLFEAFENEMIGSLQTSGSDPRLMVRIQLENFLVVLSLRQFDKSFYEKVRARLEEHSESMFQNGTWERGRPKIYDEIISACRYFLSQPKNDEDAADFQDQ